MHPPLQRPAIPPYGLAHPPRPPQPPCVAPASSPLAELLEDDPVGEALTADANAFQHPVAAQLLQHQKGVQLARLQGQRGPWTRGAGTQGAASPKSQAWVTHLVRPPRLTEAPGEVSAEGTGATSLVLGDTSITWLEAGASSPSPLLPSPLLHQWFYSSYFQVTPNGRTAVHCHPPAINTPYLLPSATSHSVSITSV